jgi:starch synthase
MKLFFLTSEITPFTLPSVLGDYSAKISLLLQGKPHDLRTMLPKYGYISERKYILREVIRLREIPFEFSGLDQNTSAKSAFIPKTRVQVYFLEHSEWFKPISNLLYKAKNGRILSDNDMRFSYFACAGLAIIPHLFWKPDMYLCHGWQSSLVPLLYHQKYKDKVLKNINYKNIKSTYIVHSMDQFCQFKRESFDAAGLTLPDYLDNDVVNTHETAVHYADKVILFNFPNSSLVDDFMKLKAVEKHSNKISVIDWDDIESPNYFDLSDKIDEVLTS